MFCMDLLFLLELLKAEDTDGAMPDSVSSA